MNFLFGENTSTEKKSYTPFQLPITYIEKNVHMLPSNVATDLELDTLIFEKQKENLQQDAENEKLQPQPIYHYLFRPKTEFAHKTIPLWKTHFTSNVQYLKDTQHVLANFNTYQKNMQIHNSHSQYEVKYDNIMEVWRSTKENDEFLDKYSYMDIGCLKWLNRMPSFLQTMSFVNMTSPVLALIIPFIFLLAPFIILKIQGVPMNLTVYIDTLCQMAKHHFIGKAVNMLRNFSTTNLIYLVIMLGFYAYQCYTNYTYCVKFYRNICEMNKQIIEMRNYLDYSIESMQQFMAISKPCQQYQSFNSVVFSHMTNLQGLRQVLSKVAPFEPSIGKITEIGLLLRCFYEIYENETFCESIHWSFGFEGYMNNLQGIHENLCECVVHYAQFTGANKEQIMDQYYPAHMNEKYVANHCSLDKNMVITGPNAAGKTTFLKTTMLNVLFSQQTGCGFYTKYDMQVYTHIHSYLNIPDTSARDSLFQAESRRCKEILDSVGTNNCDDTTIRHFCVFDELYSGTNPEEATKSAYAFLRYLSKFENVDFILTTHYVSVCKRLQKVPTVRNWKMDAIQSADGEIQYTYKIAEGISTVQGAYSVLRDMGYPAEILETICKYDEDDNKKNRKKQKKGKKMIKKAKNEE